MAMCVVEQRDLLACPRLLLLFCSCLCLLNTLSAGLAAAAGVDSAVRRVPDEQRLYETIMTNYQQSVMPHVTNSSYTLTVAFSLRLNQIVTLDERKQVLTTNVFIDQTWIDPGLAWDPNNFTDVRALRIPADHVWLPDTFVYNNADGGTAGFMRGTYVQIQSNGKVLWPVPLRLRSSCSVHITYFPFDSQICTLRFGSWIYGLQQLDYRPLTDNLTVDPSSYVNNSEWELVSITMHKALSPAGGPGGIRRLDPHPHLTYVLHLKRNTFFYLFNIIVPCVMLSTLNILTFWLPPVSGEKVTLGLSVFLAFSMFMLLIAEEVPATSEAVPLIGVYLCMVMTMTSLSVMMAVVVTNLYHRGRKMRPAPRWLATLCLRWLARPFCVLNDIPLISSTVDLVEHCQYDVSHKRTSQPTLEQNVLHTPSLPLSSVPQILSRTTPTTLPTHLQNGGYVRRDHIDSDPVWRVKQLEDDTGTSESSLSMPQKSSTVSALLNGVKDKAVIREVHPRARNSVVSSHRFTKIPTVSHDLHDDHETVSGSEEEEEEVVWRKRDSSQSSDTELRPLSGRDKEGIEDDEVDEDRDQRRSLLANSRDDHHMTNHQTALGGTACAGLPPSTAAWTSSRPTDAGLKALNSQFSRGPGSKLDPHPTSSDLQSAKTMIAEWQQIATVVDRLMFVLYVVTTVTAYVIILVIVPANQPPVNVPFHNSSEVASVRHQWGG